MSKNLFKLGLLVVLTVLFGAMAFAQTTWYVNSTNGDDLIYNGLSATATGPSVGPYKTIGKAVTASVDGDIISVAAGAYPEAVTVGKNLTMISTTFLSSSIATISNGLTINTAAKTLNLGRTSDGSQQFNLGGTANALVLTAGTLNIDAANVTIATGGTIQRTAGTVSNTPTTTNVNVTYTNTATISAGPEIPASLGSGSLLISSTGATTVTFTNPIGFTGSAAGAGGMTFTSGNATFNGLITFDAGGTTLSLGGTTAPATMINSGTGTVTVNSGITWTVYGGQNFATSAIDNDGGTFNIASAVSFVHSAATIASSGQTDTDVTGTISNSGSGTLTIGSLSQTSNFVTGTTNLRSVIISVVNSNTGTFTISGAATVKGTAANSSSGTLAFGGAATITGTSTNSSTGTMSFTGGTMTGTVGNTGTGTIALNAATTFAGATTNSGGGTIKLNTFTLTLSGATSAFNNTGSKVISATAGQVGTGVLSYTGSGAVVLTPGSELTGIIINHSNAGTGGVTIGAAATLNGDLTVTSGTLTINGATEVKGATLVNGGALALGSSDLTADGSYSQTSGSITFGANSLIAKNNVIMTGGTVTNTGGTLAFGSGTATGADQVFTPIPNLSIFNLVINNPTRKVTLGASLILTGDATITAGTLDLSTFNIRMQGAGKTFTNTGGYTSSGGGTLIWEVAGTVTGVGTFANLDIRTGGATTVDLGSNITISGVLYLRGGDLDIRNRTLTFSDVNVTPQIYKSVLPSGGGSASIIAVGGGGGGTIAWNLAATVYDLTYYGDADWSVLATHKEWVPARLRNLTIMTGDGAATPSSKTVTLPAGAVTMTGVMNIYRNQTLNLGGNTVTASGASKAHQITGTLSNGTFDVNGASATLTGVAGAVGTTGAAAVNNLIVSGAGVTVTNLHTISGTLSVTGASASITMNTTASTITGAVTINPTTATDAVTLVAAATSGTFSGSLTLTKGLLSLTLGGATQQNIAGAVTLTAGTLTLGSSVNVSGVTNVVDGNIALNGFNYTQKGSGASGDFNRTGTGTVTGTGRLIFDSSVAAIDITPGTSFTVSDVTFTETAANGITLNAGGMTVSGTLVHTAGAVTLTGSLTFSGTAYTFTAGSYAGAGKLIFTGSAPTITAAADMTVAGGFTINSAGTVTFRSDQENASTPVYRTFTSAGPFLQTAGNVDIGNNTLEVTGVSFTRVLGGWSMNATNGLLKLNRAGITFAPGVGMSVPNLTVSNTMTLTPTTNAFTVTGIFSYANAVTLGVDNKLILGDGATITATANASALDFLPSFPTSNNVNVIYNGNPNANTGTVKELPAIVNNLTTTAAATLNANVTVNGTLAIGGGTLTNVASTKNVTFGPGGILEMNAGGALAVPIVPPTGSGLLNLVYNGVAATSNNDWPATANIGSVTVKANTDLHAARTVTGTMTVGNAATAGRALDIKTFPLTLQGNVTFVNGGNFAATGGPTDLIFSGASNTTLTLDANKSVALLVRMKINKTNSTNTVTLRRSGATYPLSLDFDANAATLYFVKGVLVTDSNVVFLKQTSVGGQPTQGFDRSGVTGTNESHVFGNVKKKIDNANTATTLAGISKVEYPVGSSATLPYYRPMSLFFKTNPQSTVFVTVSHVDTKAGGQNGFPITAGTKTITNYPDFFWYASSDIALAPSYKYDLEAQAKGYTDYLSDQIQNVRFVRRDSGSSANQWILQGSDANYDNSTIASNWPVVKVIDAQGGITSQGSIFTYSQSNKAPSFTVAGVNAAINEGVAYTRTFTATDPDLNQTVTYSAVSIPTGATFNATTGVLSWTPGFNQGSVAGTPYAVTIRVTDGFTPKDTTFTLTVMDVNRSPAFTTPGTLANTSVAARTTFTFTYAATDVDNQTLTYSILAGPAGATINASTGVLTWLTDIAQIGPQTITVSVTDGIASVNTTATVTVTAIARVPVFTTLGTPPTAVQNVNMGGTFTFAYAAADSDGLTLKYKIMSGPGTIDSLTGAFSWTVPYGVQQTYPNDVIVVRATNTGNLFTEVTLTLARQFVNVKPTFSTVLTDRTVFAGDVLDFTYAATDPNEASATVLRYTPAKSGGNSTLPTWLTLDSLTGRLSGTATATQTAIYLIKVYVADPQGLKDSTQALLTVQVVTVNITGIVTYGTGTTPVSAATVTLTPSTGAALTTTTSAAGAYAFNAQPSGTYTLAVTKTGGHPTVNTNAADALRAALYPTSPTAITDTLAKRAADVNNDATVNAADALQIMLRYVGTLTSFAKGDWIFVPAQTTIVAASSNITDNVAAIAVGDVNVDAVPSSGTFFAKVDGATQSVVPATGATLQVNSTDVFEIPVRVKAATSIGSMSMAFQYATESATFLGVRGPDGMVSAANNGVVAVAWFNAENALNLKENDAVVVLRFKPTSNVKDFSLTLDPNSQITDAIGKVLSGINLEVPAVDGSLPSSFAIGQNYPNPFNPSTTIQYDLPVAGHVTLVVYNMLGQIVDKLVDDQQNAGAYKIRWDASKLSSGVYMYHISVDAGKQSFKEVRRMTLLK